MLSYVPLSLGSAAVGLWGLMHLAKTRTVVAGFEPLTEDNRHVLRMEWIVEGVALVFVAVLIGAFTAIQGPHGPGAWLVFGLSAGFLFAMAIVSLFTGARASPLPYKFCAPIFAGSALLILLGAWVL